MQVYSTVGPEHKDYSGSASAAARPEKVQKIVMTLADQTRLAAQMHPGTDEVSPTQNGSTVEELMNEARRKLEASQSE
jgi:hypothetical protein